MGSDGFHRNGFRRMGSVKMGFAGKCVNGFRRGPIPEKKSNMDLDKQIAQLMECKPLVEQQVPL
ncbi:hypothetical protein FH972_002301 [Carpinus fangiana]|uniref:Uncharacterized protein n=1 Tax=Carpinus fangiana TaxID=176857 RepID=A0A5N6QGT4_9ROSI|nr:hypothetical protein FH972_002301 [Carpinus fangiana]